MRHLFFLLVSLLVACSTTHQRDIPTSQPQNQYLEPWGSWHLAGRILVRTESDGWFANLSWSQTGERYQMDIRGPLGQGLAELTGNADKVWLRSRDGRLYSDHDPDALIQQVVGVNIPVSGLRYWVHGVAEPGQPETSRWNQQGLRSELRQSGWIIQFDKYHQVQGRWLPTRIDMRHREYTIKLRIDDWRKGAVGEGSSHSAYLAVPVL